MHRPLVDDAACNNIDDNYVVINVHTPEVLHRISTVDNGFKRCYHRMAELYKIERVENMHYGRQEADNEWRAYSDGEKESLRDDIRRDLKARPGAKLMLRTDINTCFERVYSLMKIANEQGISHIDFSVLPLVNGGWSESHVEKVLNYEIPTPESYNSLQHLVFHITENSELELHQRGEKLLLTEALGDFHSVFFCENSHSERNLTHLVDYLTSAYENELSRVFVTLEVHPHAHVQRFIDVLSALKRTGVIHIGIKIASPDDSERGMGSTGVKMNKSRRSSKRIVEMDDLGCLSAPINANDTGARFLEEICRNYKLMREQPEMAAKCCESLDEALNEYIRTDKKALTQNNEYLPNMFFLAAKANAAMAQYEPAQAEEYRNKALQLCESFMKFNFRQANPDRVHDLSATVKSMAAGFILSNEIKEDYVQAVRWYEEAAMEAIAMPEDKGRETAATCYLKLTRGYRICMKDGEDAYAQRARRDSYIERFWNDVDNGEPNRFALQMVRLYLDAVDAEKDRLSFETAVAKAEEIIKREAAQKNAVVEDVYDAIDALVAAKYEGAFGNQDYSALAAYVDSLAAAPELSAISAQAALTMSKVNILLESAVEGKDKLIEDAFNSMEQQYRTKINQHSAEACYIIAQTLLNMAENNEDKVCRSEMAKRTYPYYDRALTTNDPDLLPLVCCGKARALTIVGGADNAKEASKLYDKVLASGADYEVINIARFGKADSLLANKEYDALIKLAKDYLADDSTSFDCVMMCEKLAFAYEGKGEIQQVIDVYYNLYRDNLGIVSVSAPACRKMMEMLYARNSGEYKDNGNGTFKHSDRWTAWYRGKSYCDMLKNVCYRMEPSDRMLYDEVRALVARYQSDFTVSEECRKEAEARAKNAL